MTKKYRPSVYNIPVDLEDGSGQTLLIHGYTGAMDIASEAIIECLQPGEEYTSGSFPLSEETFRALVSRGYLTERTEEEEYEYVKRFSNIFNRCEQKGKKGFTFMVTYNCNFRCPYCFEGGVSHKGRQWSGKVFTRQMVDRAYQAMEEIASGRDNIYNNITLYGGEPLLAINKEIVSYIVAEGQKRNYVFSAVTNGYDLDSYLDLLGADKIRSLQITIDGEKEFHDKRRVHYRQGKSYEKIMENIGKALNTGVHITVRANTDGRNIESMQRLKEEFRTRGFYECKNFGFYAALLCGSASEKEAAKESNRLSYLTRKELLEKIKKEGHPFKSQDYGLYDKIYQALEHSTRIRFHTIFCPSQTSSYILDPYGEIYTCWNTVGIPERVLGCYLDGITWNDEEIQRWHNRYIGSLPKCATCKYALFCGGGCAGKVITEEEGDLTKDEACDEYPEIFHTYALLAYQRFKKSVD